jgi:hypothetical protein
MMGKSYNYFMPTISEFFGVKIFLYYGDHNPPHFHAEYSGEEACIAIGTFAVICGGLPPRVIGLVLEWAVAHRTELMENWELCRRNVSPLKRISPLI